MLVLAVPRVQAEFAHLLPEPAVPLVSSSERAGNALFGKSERTVTEAMASFTLPPGIANSQVL